MCKAKLTPKQEEFANRYVECGNASQAYRLAYCVDRMAAETIWKKASLLLQRGDVRGRIEELQAKQAEKHSITQEGIVKDLLSLVAVEKMEYIEYIGEDGTIHWKNPKEWTKEMSHACKGFKVNSFGQLTDIILYDRAEISAQISKMLGLDAPQKVEQLIESYQIVVKSEAEAERKRRLADV